MKGLETGSSLPPWLDRLLHFLLKAWKIYWDTERGKIAIALVSIGSVGFLQGWSPWSWAPMSVGILLSIWITFTEWHAAMTAPRRIVVAVCHQSFESLARSLATSPPPELSNFDIQSLDINQTSFYEGGILTAPSAAVRMQIGLANRVRAFLDCKPDAGIVYYGKAHIPLVFLAGHTLSTGMPVRFFELDRHDDSWWAIDEAAVGHDLGFETKKGLENVNALDAVIRVSITCAVGFTEVAEVVLRPYRDVHLRIADPGTDRIQTKRQIEIIARAFRKSLDELKHEQPESSRIHVFYSGPMSLAFCLGRQISPTIHPPIFVYNFTHRTTPKYAWALHINGNGPPESLIVPTLSAKGKVGIYENV